MEICKNCKHWDYINKDIGICDRVEYLYLEYNAPQKQYDFAITICAADDSGLEGILYTGPEFYCAKFEMKKERD